MWARGTAIASCSPRGAAVKHRSYTAAKFSFNSGDGRCPTCTGSGFEHVEMQFLSDVYLRCPDCDGKRYRPDPGDHHRSGGRTLNVADVLELTVAEAGVFANDRDVVRPWQPIVDVGLTTWRWASLCPPSWWRGAAPPLAWAGRGGQDRCQVAPERGPAKARCSV